MIDFRLNTWHFSLKMQSPAHISHNIFWLQGPASHQSTVWESLIVQSLTVFLLPTCYKFRCACKKTRLTSCRTKPCVFFHRDLDDVTHRGIQCLFWWHCLPVFIQSEAYYHNSQVIRDILQLIGYNDSQSGAAPAGALHAVAQHRHAFRAWEYWETVWDAGERRREDSSALQTWVDVESVLSAGGVHRKWPSICGQGNVSPTPDAQTNSRISPERCLMWRAARKLTGSHPGEVHAECALCLQAYAVLLTFSSHCLFSEKSRYCIVVRVALIYCWARAIVWL